MFFFFNDTATTEIYTLSLHDALPISDLFQPAHNPLLFRLGLLNDQIDRSGEPVPVCGFLFQRLTAGRRQRVELRRPSRITLLPFPAYPSLLLQSVQRRIQ